MRSVTGYGRFDRFRDPLAWDEAEARDWAERLESRGRILDEREIRAAYLELLGIGPGQRVLDVGCGSGVVTRDIVRRVAPGGAVVGLDPSAALLACARELARAEGLHGGLEFHQGEAR